MSFTQTVQELLSLFSRQPAISQAYINMHSGMNIHYRYLRTTTLADNSDVDCGTLPYKNRCHATTHAPTVMAYSSAD